MSKKPNAWMAHVMRTKAANPGMQLKDVLRKAGETYKKDSGASASASASSTKHKTHKKHGGVLPMLGPMFGGRKRRGGEPETNAAETNAAQTNASLPGAANDELIQTGGGPLNLTAYGGGKKSRRSRKGKSSRKSKKRSRRHRK